jgi:hypothetical protein
MGCCSYPCLSCFAVEGRPRDEHVNDAPAKPARPPCTGTTLAKKVRVETRGSSSRTYSPLVRWLRSG